MKNQLIITVLLFSVIISNAQTSFKSGDAELDADLNEINVSARLDFAAFKTDLRLSYDISENKIDYLSVSVRMEPAEIYLALELSLISGKPVDDVVEIYKINRDKGWGAIAKMIGIKPGSDEFHKLKETAKNKGSKSKNKGAQGKGKK